MDIHKGSNEYAPQALQGHAVTAILTAATATPALAAEKNWEFEFTPYLWGMGIDGDAIVNGQPVKVDSSFSDIIDAMEIGGGLLLRGERAHWVLWTQVDYLATSTDELDDPPERGSTRHRRRRY